MARTYIPTLIRRVRVICIYATKYRETILEFLSPEAAEAFNALADACQAFLDLVLLDIEP